VAATGEASRLSQSEIQGPSSRDGRLDALRGAAAMSVAVGHCASAASPHPLYDKTFWQIDLTSPTDILLRAVHAVFNADAAVLLFFVLSGHVLFASLGKISRHYPPELVAYAIKRLLRIMPVLIVGIVPFAYFKHLSWQVLIACMLLLRTDAMGLTWTLQVEMIGSLLVFVAILAWRWHPAALTALFAITLAVAIAFGQNYLLRFLPLFLIGCALGPYKSRCDPSGALFWTGLVALMLADLVLGKGTPALLVVAAGATLIVANASAPAIRFLDGPLFQRLGRLSYSFYLLHPAAMALAKAMLAGLGIAPHSLPALVDFLLYVVLSLALALPLAQLAHLYVERPGIALGRRLAQRVLDRSGPELAASNAATSGNNNPRAG
jgi:peptidoglycan/LPS O-acetylase OafA/YrhL